MVIGVFWFLIGGRDVASSRLQGYIINQALSDLGYNSKMIYAPKAGYMADAPDFMPLNCNLRNCVAVIQKLRGANTDRLCQWLRSRGCKVVYVNCDIEISNASWVFADQLLVTTDGLRDYHERQSNIEIALIDEPYEFASPPRTNVHSDGRIMALWFGNGRNWAPLAEWKAIIESKFSHQVRLVTCSDHDLATYGWTLEVQRQLLVEADIVLLPTGSQEYFRVKSANRLIQGMATGNAIIHGELDSFRRVCGNREVSIEVANNSEFSVALSHMINAECRRALAWAAYNHVVPKYSPVSISTQWASILNLQQPTPSQKIKFFLVSKALRMSIDSRAWVNGISHQVRKKIW